MIGGLGKMNRYLLVGESAQCGEMRTWIVGVNWYLNDYVRMMFNYAEVGS